jgi:hypothetical protein
MEEVTGSSPVGSTKELVEYMTEGEPTREQYDPADVTTEFKNRSINEFREFFESLVSGTYYVKMPLADFQANKSILDFFEGLYSTNTLKLLVTGSMDDLTKLQQEDPGLYEKLVSARKVEFVTEQQ